MFQLKNISYTFPGLKKPLLENISLHIPKGSMTTIMGLNGTGKTTLLRIMSSYLKPVNGDVAVEDRPAKELSPKELAKKIAFVPQEFPTEFPYTVQEFIMMGRYAWQDNLLNQKEDFEKTHAVLQRLNLEALKNRTINTLSGGEKQRALLAKAIIQNTQAILLDEPFNHLDIKNKKEFLTLLQKENNENKTTIIAIMHSLEDAKEFFTDVVFLKDGKCFFHGKTSEGFKANILKDVFEVAISV